MPQSHYVNRPESSRGGYVFWKFRANERKLPRRVHSGIKGFRRARWFVLLKIEYYIHQPAPPRPFKAFGLDVNQAIALIPHICGFAVNLRVTEGNIIHGSALVSVAGIGFQSYSLDDPTDGIILHTILLLNVRG